MLGQLPTSLEIGGETYKIRADYRNILQIITAYEDEELRDNEKVLICLKRLYVDFDTMPADYYAEAYEAASKFIEYQAQPDKPSPKVVDWTKDEPLIFAAVNKVAGREVRALDFMHWWTFLGFFQSVDRDDIWGFVLTIRQKKAKGRKLEKYETEFYNANRSMCDLRSHGNKKKEAQDYMAALYEALQEKG